MPKSQIFPAICFLLEENLKRYSKNPEVKSELENAFLAFQTAGFQESTFDDSESI